MACTIVTSEAAVFALWGKPHKVDIDDVFGRVQAAARSSGRPIVFVARIPVEAPPPEPDVRRHLNELMPAFREVCASYHVILEGDGFLSAIKRSMLAQLMQLGWPRDTFFVHASPREIPFKAPRAVRSTAESLLRVVERHGLLSAPAPAD